LIFTFLLHFKTQLDYFTYCKILINSTLK